MLTFPGLSDDMKKNFNLMKAMGDHTRPKPAQRIERLLKFNQSLNSKENVTTEFERWNLQLENKLCEITGRVLPEEQILLGGSGNIRNHGTNWQSKLRAVQMFRQVELANWVIIFPRGKNHEIGVRIIKMLIESYKL